MHYAGHALQRMTSDRELRRQSVTLQLLWEEYRAQAQGVPYSRARFCERYTEFRQRLRRTMRQTHVAGEKLFVDYAGPTVPLIDPASGEITRAHIFVAVWGASNYTLCRGHRRRVEADWIAAHVRALTFFGGAPALPQDGRSQFSGLLRIGVSDEFLRTSPRESREPMRFAPLYALTLEQGF